MTTLSRCSAPALPRSSPSSNTRASASKLWRMAYSQSHQNDMVLRLVRESGRGSNALSQPTNFSANRFTCFRMGPIA